MIDILTKLILAWLTIYIIVVACNSESEDM